MNKLCQVVERHKDLDNGKESYLYVLSDGEIIATTDAKMLQPDDAQLLDVYPVHPGIPESFIEAYTKAGSIDEVLVEYTKVPADRAPDGWSISLKLREDNTIIIHQAMTYSRGKVEQLLHTAVNDSHCGKDRVKSASSNNCAKFVIDWIKENFH